MAALTPDRQAASSRRSPPIDFRYRASVAGPSQARRLRSRQSDGKWDDGSKKALEPFNKNAQTKFDIKLASLDALDAVRSKTDRVVR